MEEIEKAKAILFDLDGVIIDSFEVWYKAFNDTLEKFNIEKISRDTFRKKHWGPGLGENMKKLGLGDKGKKHCLSKYSHHIDQIEILPGAREIIEILDGRKGLVTNTPKKATEKILDRLGLAEEFDIVVTGDSVKKTKPAPNAVLEACKQLKIEPNEAVLIGDTESDVKSARSAGCKVIGIGVEGDIKFDDTKELYKKIKYTKDID